MRCLYTVEMRKVFTFRIGGACLYKKEAREMFVHTRGGVDAYKQNKWGRVY